ncbi:MAG: type IX secretion system membrane protein PorP/SprF [Prolixibacteraceae bacterium]|nr:type IX secretion system membrane protein PorP/SprF [Prolixibacteraceae bacterium]
MKTLFNKIQYLSKMNNCAKWIVVVLILAGSTVQAQQEPTYTQYMFNTQTVNPAYAGSWETMGFMVLAREQWTGIENAPSTQTFTFQTLHKNEKVGLGLNIINDKFGLEKRLSVFGDYSYLLQVNDAGLKLRLGLKAGFSSYSNNLSSYDVIDNDPRFMGSSKYSFMPNFGVGAFLYENRYYVGISVPKMIQNEFKNEENYSTQAELRHFFLMAGYVFELSENLKFKPTLLGKVTAGAPLQMDVTTNFLIADRVWLGAMYRTGDSFGLLAQWIINNKLRFGYSVDFATSQLKSYQSGTHEVMISYEIGGNRNQSIASRLF